MFSRSLPDWLSRLTAYGAATLVLGAVAYVALWLLAQIYVVALGVVVAVLLAALLQPVAHALRALGAPLWAAATGTVAFLLLFPVGIGYLVVSQALRQLTDLRAAVTNGLDDVRDWLVTGPLSLSEQQVDQVFNTVVDKVEGTAPGALATAALVLNVLGGAVLALFVLFFFLKDGTRMWDWALGMAPERHRARVDGAGRIAWSTLSGYVAGTVVVALIDAVFIGLGLWVVGIPLVVPLALLVFLGAFVPILGATVSGVVAIAVALATEGVGSALAVLGVVLGVQQVEGNLLQPLIIGRTVHLHPVAILLSVSAGYLLAGIAGAVIATPLVAVSHQVGLHLRQGPAASGHRGQAGRGGE